MNTIAKAELPLPGSPLGGGYYTGLILSAGQLTAIITAPKATGQLQGHHVWGNYGTHIDAANVHDGRQNTIVMATAGNAAAREILDLVIDGNNDWYWPARDEKELQYRTFKPTTHKNYCGFRDGANTNSVPIGHDYTKDFPAQTSIALFQQGQPEAFDPEWYWSSTQFSADDAYVQDFSDGYQSYYHKGNDYRVRAVRRLLVIE